MILQKIDYHRYIKVNDATENYILQEIKELNEAINKDDDYLDHNHDNLYFRQEEINALLSNKSNVNHTHDASYYTKKQVVDLVNNMLKQEADDEEIIISYNKPNKNCKIWFKLLE